MSEWRKVALGDVIELKRGYDLPKSRRREGSVPIVSSSGPTGFHDEAKARGPGVVTGRYGTLGEVFYIEEDFWPLNTALYVRDFKGNHPRFVAALLSSLDLGRQDAAAAVPGLNRNHLHVLPVTVPDLSTQVRIADVLAALDGLIENNRQRTALLEQMAQAIYREWFVHFRYPGHEDDELIDSPLGPIPAGWSASRLGDVVELRYGRALKASSRRGGPVAVVGSSGVVGWHDESLVSGPAVVVGRKGNVGSVTWIQGDSWPIDTTYWVTTDLPLHFVYRMLGETEFIDSHAAVPGLSRDQAYSIDVLCPGVEVAALFEDTASELSTMSSVLESQAAVLSRGRDVLLPKLVTGTIDVSKLDLDALLGESAA